jgi:hypothetical protein
VVGAVLVWKYGPGLYRRHQADVAAQRRRNAEISARADEQHRWMMAGDDRGV